MRIARNLYTIGHSNHGIEIFLGLLKAHRIETLIDVRSWPASRRLPHFNRAALQESLTAAGIRYLWFGKELGGKSDWVEAAASPAFRTRIGELAELAEGIGVVLMCAEEDPTRCHRRNFLAEPLAAQGVALNHIRRDGNVIADAALNDEQLSLFTER